MRLRLTLPASSRAALGSLLEERGGRVEAEAPSDGGAACSLTVQVEPGVFRDLHAFMQGGAKHEGRIEVLSFAVTTEGGGDDGGEYAAALAAAAAVSAAAGPRPGGGDEADAAPAAAAPRPLGAAAAAARRSRGALGGGGDGDGAAPSGRVVYERGPIAGLPEAFASRRERFQELDDLQPGWLVELCERGDSVDAVFFSPAGERVGPYAAARRAALQWKQAQQRGA
jgi:hypothetical protein